MRKSYDKTCKARVALEALRESLTIHEQASKFDVHPDQISKMKLKRRGSTLKSGKSRIDKSALFIDTNA